MRFGHWIYVYAILLLPILAFLLIWVYRLQKKTWDGFADSEFKGRLMPNYAPGRTVLKTLLKLIGLFFLILALMEPQWGTREEEVTVRGVNVMLLVDLSDSMLAQDLKPNRLAREKLKVRELLGMLVGDRVGLIAFSGRSFLLSPLTNDYGTLDRYVDELTPDTIPVEGTDIAGALQLALKTLPDDDSTKAILLFTDGEDHSHKMVEIIKEIKKRDIKVFVLGFGSPQGAPVPEPGGGFKKNLEGKTVVSKLQEGFLKDLALDTGGVYARTVSSEEDLEELYVKGIRGALTPSDLTVSKKKVWESRYYWPLGIALVFLIFERLIAEGKKRPREEFALESE